MTRRDSRSPRQIERALTEHADVKSALASRRRMGPRAAKLVTDGYFGVANRVRTGDIQDHNLALYQLSYGHRERTRVLPEPSRLCNGLGSRPTWRP